MIAAASTDTEGPGATVLSLFDGMGGISLTLKETGGQGITRVIAIEKDLDKQRVCQAANPKTESFPGVDHGLNGKHNVEDITEEDIKSIKDLAAVVGAPPCQDFSKLRKLPDRPGYKGPPRHSNKDPRRGLQGKTGKMFLKLLEIIKWAKKWHPASKYFTECVEFMDMRDDWATVTEALGAPHIIVHHDHSYTKRTRAYWTDLDLPSDFKKDFPPLDPDECMDPGRKVQRYMAHGRRCVRPIGASWTGTDEEPVADTGMPLLIDDEQHDDPQHLRPHEAEKLMGMPQDCTAGAGIGALLRLRSIGDGWDINVIRMFIKHLQVNILAAHVDINLSRMEGSEVPTESMDLARQLAKLSDEDPETFGSYVGDIMTRQGMKEASKLMALPTHYKRICAAREEQESSILDSGAARHIHPHTQVTDPENKTRLLSFTGLPSWTQGNGYIPITTRDKRTGHDVDIDIPDADYMGDTAASLLSVSKLIKDGWGFNFTRDEMEAHTPAGHIIEIFTGADGVLRMPHTIRKGKAAQALPIHAGINVASQTKQGATIDYLHRLFNHAPVEKIIKTLEATEGYRPPEGKIESHHCTACAQGNARKLGLRHTVLGCACHTSTTERPIYSSTLDMRDLTAEMECAAAGVPEVEIRTQFAGYDTESELPELLTDSESDTDDDDWALVDPDYDPEYSSAPVYVEAEEPEDSDYFEDENHDKQPEPARFKAKVKGRSTEGAPPRFDIDELKPWEIMFGDEKEYQVTQRGGIKRCYLILELKSDGWFVRNEVSKTEHGESFRSIMVENGVHLLPYPRTIYTDGCGSNKYVKEEAIEMGIHHVLIPPHDASLNQAEQVVDRAFAAARVHQVSCSYAPELECYAVGHVCYMKLRCATTVTRHFITPHEVLKGEKPSIRHCQPFYTKAYVHVPKSKRAWMEKNGKGHLRAEEGRLLGYQDMYSTTAKVLLDGNRMVHSRNVTYDIYDYGQDTVERPSPEAIKDNVEVDTFHNLLEDITQGDYTKPGPSAVPNPEPRTEEPLTVRGVRGTEDAEVRGASPTHDLGGSESDPEDKCVDVEVDLTQDDKQGIIPWPGKPSPERQEVKNRWDLPWRKKVETKDGKRAGRNSGVQYYKPGDTKTEANTEQRGVFLAQLDQIQRLDHDMEVFSARLDRAMRELHANDHEDPAAVIYAASEIAQHAQKDMNWKKALASEDKDAVIEALNLELTSLQKTILTQVTQDDHDFTTAVETATPGRLLLDIKRSGKYKCRGVKQGFKENKELSDGPDFVYYSNVVKLNAVRVALFKRRRRGRVTGIKDVSTAFLQSNPYPEGTVKYISFKHPISGQWMYFRQSGPIYGEASAPARWEQTIAPWLEEQGFKRGCNEPGVFYHSERDLLLLLYVDDLLAEGDRSDVEWIFNELEGRFDCKDADYLEPGTNLDYLGMDLIATKDQNCISMKKYIQNAIDILGLQDHRKASMPISEPIEGGTLLMGSDVHQFMSALGMLGWLASTARPDVSYAYSRIAQHTAKCTDVALKALYKCFAYLRDNADLCLAADIYEPESSFTEVLRQTKCDNEWRFCSDTDHAGNKEDQNRMRSQNGEYAGLNGAAFAWYSKASSVTFACEKIGEAHADTSSTAVEIYGVGNATQNILGYSYVIEEMGIDFPFPFQLEMDNRAAKIFCQGSALKTKLKHIDCRQHWVKTLRDKRIMDPVWIPTKDNLADLFTKILPLQEFIRLRDQILRPASS